MWPFNRKRQTGRVPAQRKESEIAKEAAEDSLRESRSDRDEVMAVSQVAKRELEKNHISPRIALMLKEGR